MRTPIKDEFTHLPISRQRKYQLRMERDGRCSECGEPALEGSRCLKHLIRARERQRKKRGAKRRYKNALGYRLEEKSKQGTTPSSKRGRALIKTPGRTR